MDTIALKDKSVQPDEELVFSLIGKDSQYWKEIGSWLELTFPGISRNWNFYRDGNCWLLKSELKKKTLFWTAVYSDRFNVSFWFSEKAEPLILGSDLPESIKESYRNAKRYKIGRGISIPVKSPEDVESIKKLILLKSRLK